MDTTPELIQWAASLGVGGVLAAFIFIVSHRDAKKMREEDKGDRKMLMEIVMNNTVAMTKLVNVVEELRDDINNGRKRNRERT